MRIGIASEWIGQRVGGPERYAVDLKQGLKIAKQMMEPTIHNLIRRDIGGDHQRIEMTDTRYLGVTFKHCLLPVWVANYRYQEKLFQILINGRTGKVSGERPYSFWKIFGLVALIVVVVGAIIALVMAAQGKGGRSELPAPVPQVAFVEQRPHPEQIPPALWPLRFEVRAGPRGPDREITLGA